MKTGKAVAVVSALVLALGLGAPSAGQTQAPAPAHKPAQQITGQPASQAAAQFVERLGNEAVVLLAATREAVPEERRAALRALIQRGFELEVTSRFVLGKHWTRANARQRAEFRDLFTEYLLNSYTRQLHALQAESLTILASHPVGERDILVETKVRSRDGTMSSPVWRVRLIDGDYRIIDVSLDGVSLALSQRREFAAVIAQIGLDGLLERLRAKLASQAEAASLLPDRSAQHASLFTTILASPNMSKIGLLLARR